jgi:hypothetical protein
MLNYKLLKSKRKEKEKKKKEKEEVRHYFVPQELTVAEKIWWIYIFLVNG